MTPRDATLVGTLLEQRYLVTGLLARGGMSTVYRGMDTRLERPVAIKVLHQQYAADRSWAARFEHEARAAARLHHHNVVAVHDQGVDTSGDQAHAFLVMELVEGGTLRDLLDERGALDPALALSVTEQLLAALAAAHKAGLVHRDVKPENVLIGHGAGQRHGAEHGVVKVADFGLVRAIASAGTTSSSVILGTVAYLSPEQVETGVSSERSDVYSAGLLLYEMLTGKPAFSGDTALSVAYQHVNSDVPAPSATNATVPAALDKLVEHATDRDPQRRPADAGAFLAELERARAGLGLQRVALPALPPPDGGQQSLDSTLLDMAPIDTGDQATTRSTRPNAAYEMAPGPADGPPRRSTGVRVALWALLALLLGGLVAGGAWLFVESGKVKVPKVAGQQLSRQVAEQRLAAAELEAEIVEQRHNTVEAGIAIDTDPPAGTQVSKGDTVKLMMSLGRPTVPDIEPGTSVEEAERAIRKQDLSPGHKPEADTYHDSVAEGDVVEVIPAAGTQLDIGATVQLVLSKGPPPTPVPDVTGKSKDDAFSELSSAGFEPYEAGEEFDAGIEAGKVVRTDPEAGATVGDGKPRVGVYLSNAVEVPRLVGRNISTARSTLADAGLKAKVVSGDANFDFAVVYSQHPSTGERVKEGDTVELKVIP